MLGNGIRAVAAVALTALAAVNTLLVLDLKAWLDRGAALGEFGERALRAGSPQPDELCFGPFGFVGWHLYPYYVTHDGRQSAQIDGFNLYVRPESIQVGQHYSRFLRRFSQFDHLAPADRRDLIAVGHGRCLWFYPTAYYLLRAKPSAGSAGRLQLGPDYRPEKLPLTEAEWRELIGTGRRPGNRGSRE